MSVQNPYSSAPAPQGPGPAPATGKGLGIAALVVSIVAVLLAWIPVVNLFAALLAVVALVLGIVSVVQASRARAGKGLGIASIILSVVALVVTVVVTVATVVAVDDAVRSMEDASDGEVAAPSEVVEAAADEAQVLAIGDSAEVGEYEVTVDAVNLNADAEMTSANMFNDEAKGQYVLVDMSVVYTADEEGDAWIDLAPELVGSDSRIYDTSSCGAVTPAPAVEAPTLSQGGSASYQVCFDVPAAAVKDATLRISETLSFDDTAALWATK